MGTHSLSWLIHGRLIVSPLSPCILPYPQIALYVRHVGISLRDHPGHVLPLTFTTAPHSPISHPAIHLQHSVSAHHPFTSYMAFLII